LIDYGLPRREYYHAQRFDGTLICHYRHRAHGDPFLFPGLQDISAWVDFSACAAAAAATGLTVASFTTQAQFLLATAASTSLFDLANSSPAEISAMKTLLLPGEMGERFKLLLLTRNLGACALLGRDFRNWL
jgi:SAM-dependent MidA family methyltransferase